VVGPVPLVAARIYSSGLDPTRLDQRYAPLVL